MAVAAMGCPDAGEPLVRVLVESAVDGRVLLHPWSWRIERSLSFTKGKDSLPTIASGGVVNGWGQQGDVVEYSNHQVAEIIRYLILQFPKLSRHFFIPS